MIFSRDVVVDLEVALIVVKRVAAMKKSLLPFRLSTCGSGYPEFLNMFAATGLIGIPAAARLLLGIGVGCPPGLGFCAGFT